MRNYIARYAYLNKNHGQHLKVRNLYLPFLRKSGVLCKIIEL